MTQEQLAVRAQSGDLEALYQLWEDYHNLLLSLVWKFYRTHGKESCSRHGVVWEDLKQEAFLALADAVRYFKPDRPIPFNAYLNRTAENRFQACMGIRQNRPENPLNDSLSMDTPAKGPEGEDEDPLGDFLSDPKAEAALEQVDTLQAQAWLHELLENCLEKLTPVQEAVLRRRFYLQQTRPETAQALHITPAQVRKEEEKALRVLRGTPSLQQRKEEALEAAAYQGTGWYSWYYDRGSVEERLVESRLFEG